uniref:Rho-GAP domain-containing protein n=1 Tax=Homalodisca liturata TaxID=320908 RepID=A0A1B6HUN1_9HEMI
MESKNLSLLASFDELQKINKITTQSCLEEFLSFVTSQEECRLKWFDTIRETQRLKRLLDESKKENINLDMKLTTARKLLDQEKLKKQRAEEERNKIELQLQMVRDLLFADNRNLIHDETKEKLKFLNSTVRSRISNDYNDRLSAIQELDSTGSMLSDLSFSRSDDDLDLEAVLRKKRTFKKQRPSTDFDELPSVKRRRSQVIEVNQDGVAERMVATTTVTMEHDGSVSAQSQIETIPSAMIPPPTAPTRCGSLESVESGLSIENNTGYNQGTPSNPGVLPVGSNKINMRNHLLVTKTVIRPEDCDVCEKRIKFGNSMNRCQNCRASCHPGCKDSLPLPCIAPGNTPISKKNMGVIADYVPSVSPKVPALVVHCIKEIEDRGLTETGIYRVPGSDKEIKALKEKFMRCRGVPRLIDIDIHVICGCMKDFLRNLKEPLVTHALWWQFTRAAEVHNVEERRSKLHQAISQLPQPNRDTLAYVILHLLKVAESKQANKMPISSLATVLGPTIVGYPSEYNITETYSQAAKAKLVLEQFLNMPADYWYKMMSGCSNVISTPRITDVLQSQRTPSTRSFKRLFETPDH